jgi:hypothetical protein
MFGISSSDEEVDEEVESKLTNPNDAQHTEEGEVSNGKLTKIHIYISI